MLPSGAFSIFPSALTVCSNPPFSYLPCFLVTCISNCDVPRPCLPCFSNLVWNAIRVLTVVLTMRCFHLFNHPSLCSPQMSSLPLQVFSLFVFTHHLSYLLSGNLHIEIVMFFAHACPAFLILTGTCSVPHPPFVRIAVVSYPKPPPFPCSLLTCMPNAPALTQPLVLFPVFAC